MTSVIERRTFMATSAIAILAAPLAAEAQPLRDRNTYTTEIV